MTTSIVAVAGAAGSRTAVPGWLVASSADVGDDGAVLSLPGYDASSWAPAPGRATVMGALARELGDVFYSSALRDRVDANRFRVPWWFRGLVQLSGGDRTHLRLCGVNPRADLWVNGQLALDARRLCGAYAVETVDVTDLVAPGLNALALRVLPGDPMEDLSIGWIDWSQAPPDNNMGPWRDVLVGRTGPARLGPPHVVTTFDPEVGALRALLAVTVEVHNDTAERLTVLVGGTVGGRGTDLAFRREVVLGPKEAATLAFAGDDERLIVEDPDLWWPIGEGSQALYGLSVSAFVRGALSDHASSTFGIRTVTSELRPGGGREFALNGRPVQILGAGWSPDLFLRHDPRRLADQLALTAHMGLNTIRPEGKLENPEFYELCDSLGIMVLPGWECCTKWEAAFGRGGEPWDDHDHDVAERSMASEAELLRTHPSVIAFLIGSDAPPPPAVAARYVRALNDKGWDLPIVGSATADGTEVTGPTGMKMTGPYDWVPPVYWYERRPDLGGAVGFNSETSAGHTVPRLASLQKMLSPEELDRLWQQPGRAQFHSGPPSVFDNLGLFATALAERYGAVASLEDFVAKAQLASYEAVRAQFEAYTSRARDEEPATGVIYWMLNPPWPSLNWQLFDHELDTPGAYWGAKKALEPLHVLYAYDAETVQAVNRTGERTGPLTVIVRRWRADGTLAGDDRHQVGAVEPGVPVDVAGVTAPEGVEGAWFLELELYDQAGRRSRNVYWLSTSPDVLDHSTETWYTTGVSRYADLSALGCMREREAARPRLQACAGATASDADVLVTVSLRHADHEGPPAVALHASLRRDDAPVAPVFWDDNDVTLFPGQTAVLTGRVAAAGRPGGSRLAVELDGYNLRRPRVLPLASG